MIGLQAKETAKSGPATLGQRVRALGDEVDGQIRAELFQAFRALQSAGAAAAVHGTLSRLSLLLFEPIYAAAKLGPLPEDKSLYSCLKKLGPDPATGKLDPSAKAVLPPIINQRWHTLRMESNVTNHVKSDSGFKPTTYTAENALSVFLLILEWYYVEYEDGPRLTTIYRPLAWWDSWWPPARIRVLTAILICLVVVLFIRLPAYLHNQRVAWLSGTIRSLSDLEKNIRVNPVARERFLRRLDAEIYEARSKGFDEYADYWGIKQMQVEAFTDGSDPWPRIVSVAAQLESLHANLEKRREIDLIQELRVQAAEDAKLLADIVDQGVPKYECSEANRREILKHLAVMSTGRAN